MLWQVANLPAVTIRNVSPHHVTVLSCGQQLPFALNKTYVILQASPLARYGITLVVSRVRGSTSWFVQQIINLGFHHRVLSHPEALEETPTNDQKVLDERSPWGSFRVHVPLITSLSL